MSQTTAPPGTGRGSSNVRATVRYRCAPATLGKVYLGEDHEFQHACLANLSRHGVGLILARPIPSGVELTIQIRGNDGSRVYDLTARVAHCTEEPHGDWAVGCEFIHPLSPDDLDNLL